MKINFQQQQPQQQQRQQQGNKKAGWEEAVAQLANNIAQFQKSTTASIHALKVQMGQTTAALTNRPRGSLSNNTKKNLKE